jgi:nicotinamide-nucleotide amidase
MKAEVISIGSELTSGQNLDTNSQWLSRRLAEMGIAVGWHTTVADDLDDNVDAFRIATRRANLVLATGGLGPTQDDLTREVLALLLGVELVFHAESFERVRQIFRKLNRPMPERNRVQAMFPAGAEPIPNARGTAPGLWVRVADCWVAAMPGVPSEMYAMFEEHVKPRLQGVERANGIILERKINCFGMGESAVEGKLLDLTRRGRIPEVGITVSNATISLRIKAWGQDFESAQALIMPVEQTIRDRLGTLVYGQGEEDLHDVVVRMLCERRQTVSVAEGVTAGQIAESLARVAGASVCFRGGIIPYDNQEKIEQLGVPAELIAEKGAVSAEVAQAMATGCRERFRSHFALSTVGLAGPAGATVAKPVGLVFVGLAWAGSASTRSMSWLGSRAEIQSRTAKLALNEIRLHLQSEGRS